MVKTILDTSSVIALALAQNDTRTRAGDSHALWRAHGGIDEAIEAFVLYDEVLLDKPSIQRNAERLPQILELSNLGAPLWENDSTLESRVYKQVLKAYIPRIDSLETEIIHLFQNYTHRWMSGEGGICMAAELGVDRYYPSADWRDIESELTEEAAAAFQSMRQRYSEHGSYSGGTSALLLRTLYYDCLQQLARANLVLHPMKAQFVKGLRKRSSSVLARSAPEHVGSKLIDIFDEKVRQRFYERKEMWLGHRDLGYEVPMLTAFVLNKCKSWGDIVKVVEDLRNDQHAVRFRTSVSDLLDAAENHRNEEVDAILSQLAAATENWSKDLRIEQRKRKITVTVPLINVATDVEVPEIKLSSTSGDKILVFIHSLLAES